jgi:hypothetical protein
MDNQDEIKNKMRGLGLTIDKLEKMYGKGSVSVVTLTDEQREKENKKREIARLKSLWVQFIHYKQSTELWDKIDFEQIFENSEHILNVSYSLHETGPYYNGETENEKTINKNKKAIDKLRKIFNERFKETETEFDTKNDLKICFLKELGVIDYLEKKGISNNKISEVIQYLTKTQISQGSVNTTLSRIRNEDLLNKYKTQLADLKIKFKIG